MVKEGDFPKSCSIEVSCWRHRRTYKIADRYLRLLSKHNVSPAEHFLKRMNEEGIKNDELRRQVAEETAKRLGIDDVAALEELMKQHGW